MSLKEENLIAYNGTLKKGQRLVKVGNTFIPVGVGGAFEPGSGETDTSAFEAAALAIIGDENAIPDIPTPDSPAVTGSCKYYKCASVDTVNKTWSGYELVLQDGVYVVSDVETIGLAFALGSSYTPEIGAVYSEDAMIKVRGFFNMDTSKSLTLTAVEDNSTVALTAVGSPNVAGLLYSLNKGESWETYTTGTVVTLASKDDCVQFKNTENTLSVDDENYAKFAMTGKISASGNIQSMLNFREDCTPFCYKNLFNGCTSLVTAPDMPSVILSSNCYSNMFQYTSLVTAPELPATELVLRCYRSMFNGCTSLVNAPELPATTLADRCYQYMFSSCTSLVNAPELPATTLAVYCYYGMFQECSSLVNAPELPATIVPEAGYYSMFDACTSLVVSPELPATTLNNYCYQYMFRNCTSLSSIRLYADRWNVAGWTSDWVSGVASSGTFYKPSALPEEYGTSKIPSGWTVVNIDE